MERNLAEATLIKTYTHVQCLTRTAFCTMLWVHMERNLAEDTIV